MARPTLVSLAEELGVSRQTVSNVLNAPHLVKDETRERVQAAIEASGYRPNVAAQALRSQRSMTVAMRLFPTLDTGINGAVMDRFLHALVAALRERGYALLLVTANSDDDEVETLREMATRGIIDGCVLSYTRVHDQRPRVLEEVGLTVAAFGSPWGVAAGEPGAQHVWLDVDNPSGTRQATAHLLGLGHRKVGFLGWANSMEVGKARLRGWQEAMSGAGIHPDPQWCVLGEESLEGGRLGMARLLEQGVEAAVCVSDTMALGALETYRRRFRPSNGTEVPIIGFDDTTVAAAVGLSSIAQPMAEAAELLAEGLVEKMRREGRSGSQRTEQPTFRNGQLLAPRLVVRGLSA